MSVDINNGGRDRRAESQDKRAGGGVRDGEETQRTRAKKNRPNEFWSRG